MAMALSRLQGLKFALTFFTLFLGGIMGQSQADTADVYLLFMVSHL